MDPSKKIRLSSKSQFNKNVRHEVQNLDHLRIINTTSSVTAPSKSPSTISDLCNTQCDPSFADKSERNVCDNIPSSSFQNFTENIHLISPTFCSSGLADPLGLLENVTHNGSELENIKVNIPDQLRACEIRNKITHVALGELVAIQRQIPSFENLPKCPRTFLHTPRKTILRDIKPEKYYHFGLENVIISILKEIDSSNIPDVINVAINIDGLPLSDEDFINQSDPEHHTGNTILTKISNLGLATEVPLDYVHLVCLRVVEKLLVNTWCFGKPPHKLGLKTIGISESLLNLVKYVPHEFVRKPRPIKEAERYKATELRQFLLYTGVIVLDTNLDKKKYEHFSTLHVSIRILLSDTLMKTMTNYAAELLKHFVLSSKLIYGPQILCHNFHNLLHLTDDARKYGNLNLFRNFSSENYLQKI